MAKNSSRLEICTITHNNPCSICDYSPHSLNGNPNPPCPEEDITQAKVLGYCSKGVVQGIWVRIGQEEVIPLGTNIFLPRTSPEPLFSQLEDLKKQGKVLTEKPISYL